MRPVLTRGTYREVIPVTRPLEVYVMSEVEGKAKPEQAPALERAARLYYAFCRHSARVITRLKGR